MQVQLICQFLLVAHRKIVEKYYANWHIDEKQRKLSRRLNLSRNYEMKPIFTGHKLSSLVDMDTFKRSFEAQQNEFSGKLKRLIT